MKTCVITRPKLAGRLIKAGHEASETINPFKPNYVAWEFVLDDDAVQIIKEYYDSIGCPVPKAVKEWCENECV